MNYLEESLNIDTPENVAFGYNIAGIGSRFMAALVDTVLIFIIQLLVMLPVLYFLGLRNLVGNLTTWVTALLSLLAFVFFWGYYIFFELFWNGQSPGKRMVGLRVVKKDGTPVTLPEVLIRNLLRAIDLLPTAYGVGLVTMFLDGQSRRLGDMAGGTVVVYDQKQVSLEALAPARPAAGSLAMGGEAKLPQGLPLERISAQELELVDNFLMRRIELSNSEELGKSILKKLLEKYGASVGDQPGSAVEILAVISSAANISLKEKEHE